MSALSLSSGAKRSTSCMSATTKPVLSWRSSSGASADAATVSGWTASRELPGPVASLAPCASSRRSRAATPASSCTPRSISRAACALMPRSSATAADLAFVVAGIMLPVALGVCRDPNVAGRRDVPAARPGSGSRRRSPCRRSEARRVRPRTIPQATTSSAAERSRRKASRRPEPPFRPAGRSADATTYQRPEPLSWPDIRGVEHLVVAPGRSPTTSV